MEKIGLEEYKLWFETLMDRSDDAFIVVDRKGIIRYINDVYCRFLYVTKEEALGRPIEEIIPTTSMYDVMEKKLVVDKNLWVHPYIKSADTITVSRRFCLFDDDGNVVGSMAQCKFRDMSWQIADKLFQLEEEDDRKIKDFDNIIGNDPDFLALKAKAVKIAQKDFPVFLSGETGTGKEVFAHAIHNASPRKDGPLVCINCAAIPADLMESELFGYEDGAFTGARRGGKPGKFELANHGTIFLDEIADMPLNLQTKLLRVLQEYEIERVGGTKPIPVDIRVISATRKNLDELTEQGLFREDLYYRLNVINLYMIPLRKRKSDIPLFAHYFLKELNDKYSTRVRLSRDAEKAFSEYSWPGNIRELKNVISSAYASLDGLVIGRDDLPPKISRRVLSDLKPDDGSENLSDAMDRYEAYYIRDALEKHDFHVSECASALGIDRTALWRKMKKYGITIKKGL